MTDKFIFAYVDKNRTPEIPKKFNVSAYPSMIVLNEDLKAIYRFSGFQKPPGLIDHLDTALERWALHLEGKPWVPEPTRPATLVDHVDVGTADLPTDKMIQAHCRHRGRSFLLVEKTLYVLDPRTNRTESTQLPESVGYVADMASDGTHLYLLSSGWTKGDPITVWDPATGKVVRQIVTEANRKNRSHGARGIHWHGNRLHVLEGMRGKLHTVDPKSGRVLKTTQFDSRWLNTLDRAGDLWVCNSKKNILFFNAEGKKTRTIEANYPVRTLAVDGDMLYATEQFVWDFDIDHQRVKIWPKTNRLHFFSLKN